MSTQKIIHQFQHVKNGGQTRIKLMNDILELIEATKEVDEQQAVQLEQLNAVSIAHVVYCSFNALGMVC